MKTLVTGANGFIGSHLVEGLVERNYDVYCLVRKTSDLKWIKNLPVKFVYGDINDYSSLIKAVKDKEIVFHLAGLTKAYDVKDYYKVNAEGSKNLFHACKEAGNNIKKIVYLSSLAITGPANNKNSLTEDVKCYPISDYGKSKYEGEKYAIEFMKELPITIIRPPVVYGPRDKDVYFYFQFVNKGIRLKVGYDEKYVSVIYVKDLVRGMVLVVESEKSTGQIYFISEGKMYSYDEIGDTIASALNKKGISITVPYFVAQGVSIITELISHITKKPALLNRQKFFEMKQKYWICSPVKAMKELGFTIEYPLLEGIKITADWYKENHWL